MFTKNMLVTGLVRAQEFGSGPTEGFGQQVSVGQEGFIIQTVVLGL